MPAVNLSPFGPKPQFLLSTGLPAVGGLLFFYVAGSVNTKLTTYTDSTGTVANTNPIVLNSLGEPTTQIWLIASSRYKVVYAPVGDADPPSSPIWTVDNISGINDVSSTVSEWQASGITPTYVSATQFTMPGDQRTAFNIGTKLKTTISAGTGYNAITNSTFGAGLTTVTVDGTALDSGLTAVSLSILSAAHSSLPNGTIGVFSQVRTTYGSNLAVPNGVTTSILTLINGTTYDVNAYISLIDYHAWTRVTKIGGNAILMVPTGSPYSNSANFVFSVSGNDLRITQNSGSDQVVDWTAVQMATQ